MGDTSGEVDAIARLIRVEPRKSVLRRTADDDDPVERVIVANADQLAVVTAVANPEPRPRLIDRCLVAAFDAGLDPLLIVTKVDLQPPDVLLGLYQPLGVPMVVATRGTDLDDGPHGAGGQGHGPGRALRRRQVHAGQRARPDRAADDRRGERGDRSRAAHLDLSGRAAAPVRRLGGRHARVCAASGWRT